MEFTIVRKPYKALYEIVLYFSGPSGLNLSIELRESSIENLNNRKYVKIWWGLAKVSVQGD